MTQVTCSRPFAAKHGSCVLLFFSFLLVVSCKGSDRGRKTSERRPLKTDGGHPALAHDDREARIESDRQRAVTRLRVWVLGSELSLAFLAHARRAPKEHVDRLWGKCVPVANALGITVPPLPLFALDGRTERDGAAALTHLFWETGASVARQIQDKHGSEAAALFEVAVRTNSLFFLYGKGKLARDTNEVMLGTIEKKSVKAMLPERLFIPLCRSIQDETRARNVFAELRKMHEEVSRYLQGLAR